MNSEISRGSKEMSCPLQMSGRKPVGKPRRGVPTGTLPIDETGLDREHIHRIKKAIGAKQPDWVRITKEGEVIFGENEEGFAEGHGVAENY